MTNDRVFMQFQWQDPRELTWDVIFYQYPGDFRGFAESGHHGESNRVYVRTHCVRDRDQKLLMARLEDVRVNSRFENRGIGTMLVKESIAECKRRGHKGIDGYLSSVDRDHLSKLIHFYKKLGFSVEVYEREQREGIGKLEMLFDDAPVR